jgi:hypothetical protein
MATIDVTPTGPDDYPLQPADQPASPPSIAEQRRAHAAANPPAPTPTGQDDYPLQPAPKTPLMDQSWSQLGKTLWDEGSRGVGLGTRAVTTGLASLPIAAADVATWPGRLINRSLGIPTTAPSDLVDRGLTAAGLPQPQTPTEQNTSTVVGGMASALPALVTSGMSLPGMFRTAPPGGPLPGLGTTTATSGMDLARAGLQGGAGAIAADKAANSSLVPPWLKPAVGLTAGLLAGGASDVGANLIGKGANLISGKTGDLYDSFTRLGMPTNLVGTLSEGELGRSAEATGMRVPFASSVVRPAVQNTIDSFGSAASRTADYLDPTNVAGTAESTGQQLQKAARDWKANFYSDTGPQAQAWQPLNQRLAGSSVDLSGYQSALDAVTKQLGLPETQKALTPGLALTLREALTTDAPGGVVPWDKAQALRKLIGQTMGVPEISQSVGMDVLKKAYAGLSGDMKNTATANGQGNLFDAANQVSTDGHAFIEGPLSKVITKNNANQETISGEQATNNVLNGGTGTMQAFRDNLPTATDQLAAFKLRQSQLAPPGTATAYDDTSTGRFLTNINRMRQQTPGGYGALYGADPQVGQQLDDLQKAAGALRQTEKHYNTSGTTEALSWLDYMKGIREAPGLWGKLGAATLPPTLGLAGGRVITDPGLARYVSTPGLGPARVPPTTAGLLGGVAGLTGQ